MNALGGASFRFASIDDNEIDGVRVSLKIDRDDDGLWAVYTDDYAHTGPRFRSPEDAYDSITPRWGHGWNLELAGS